MSVKAYYARFLLFFVVYLGVNLLIIKIKSTGYVHESVLSVFSGHKRRIDRFVQPVGKGDGRKNSSLAILGTRTRPIPPEPKYNGRTVKQILETCAENNLTTTLNRKNFLYSLDHKGLYCWIRKAGSTSFTKIFSDMNGRPVTRNYYYYKQVEFLAPKSEDVFKDSQIFRLLVVRHPFERLVSAFRDRIEDNSRYTAQSWIYAPKIFHLTRPELFESSGAIDESLFKIFHEDKRLRLVPSFKEFVRWLLQQDPDKDDPHWNQYYKHCGLCTLGYDFVLKLDNYTANDVDYLLARLRLDENSTYLPRLGQTKPGPTSFDETCNYFKNLTHEAVVNLYEKYRIDFDMFNYEFDKYFECTDGD